MRSETFIGVAALSLLAGCSKPKHQAPSSAAFSDLNPAVVARFQSMTNPVEAVTPRRVDDLFTLGPGDRVEIEILGNLTSRAITFVGPDGKIYYNLLSGLDVWGL